MMTTCKKEAANRRVENRALAQSRGKGGTVFVDDNTVSILDASAETGVPLRTIEGYIRGGSLFALADADGVFRVSSVALDTIMKLYAHRRGPVVDSAAVAGRVRA